MRPNHTTRKQHDSRRGQHVSDTAATNAQLPIQQPRPTHPWSLNTAGHLDPDTGHHAMLDSAGRYSPSASLVSPPPPLPAPQVPATLSDDLALVESVPQLNHMDLLMAANQLLQDEVPSMLQLDGSAHITDAGDTKPSLSLLPLPDPYSPHQPPEQHSRHHHHTLRHYDSGQQHHHHQQQQQQQQQSMYRSRRRNTIAEPLGVADRYQFGHAPFTGAGVPQVTLAPPSRQSTASPQSSVSSSTVPHAHQHQHQQHHYSHHHLPPSASGSSLLSPTTDGGDQSTPNSSTPTSGLMLLDADEKRRQQMERNRRAAKLHREKQKRRLAVMESQVETYRAENAALRQELAACKAQLEELLLVKTAGEQPQQQQDPSRPPKRDVTEMME